MMRTVWRAGFVCLLAGALAVGAVVLGVIAPRHLAADPGKRVRLLVKCDPDELTKVLAELAKTKAEVWDLDRMALLQRVAPAKPVTRKPAAKKTAPAPGPVPPLRDAGQVMEEILLAVASVKPTGNNAAPVVTEMIVQLRRAMIGLTAASGADVDRVRKAIAANPWLKPRVLQVATGAAQRVGGMVQQKLVLKFADAEPGQAVPLTQLDMKVLERVLRPHKLMFMFAGAVQKDPNRKAGHLTTSREYTLQSATLLQLRAVLKDIPTAQPGLVAFEVRWKDSGGTIFKPVVRVGGRAPTP